MKRARVKNVRTAVALAAVVVAVVLGEAVIDALTTVVVAPRPAVIGAAAVHRGAMTANPRGSSALPRVGVSQFG